MRRHLSLALAAATLALAVAGFLAEPAPAAASHSATRTLSSPLVDMEAVSSTTPRLDAFEGRLRLLTPKTTVPAVLLFGCALALAAWAFVPRRRPGRAHSLPAWSASLRGPPRLAAL